MKAYFKALWLDVTFNIKQEVNDILYDIATDVFGYDRDYNEVIEELQGKRDSK